jgi:hypothetical protein
MEQEATTTSDSAANWVASATLPEMSETMARLAADPELRKTVEARIRAEIGCGDRFWIDGMGVGHYQGELHVTSLSPITLDTSSGRKT